MKKTIITLLAVAMAAATTPAFAAETVQDGSGKAMNDQQVKECDLLIKSCAIEVDSIQERISRLKTAINEKGADAYTLEELKTLDKKLKEANETMRVLTKPGGR